MKSLTRRHQHGPNIRVITGYGVLLVVSSAFAWLSVLIWFSKQVAKVINTPLNE